MIVLFYNPSWAAIFLPILTTQDTIMSVLVIGILGTIIMIVQVWQNLAKVEKNLTQLVQNLAINDYIGYEEKKKSDMKKIEE